MTHDRRTQARAIVLSVLMVVSIFGASIAFTGSAAATATGVSVDTAQPVQPGQDVDITADFDQSNDVIIALDGDGNGNIESDETLSIFTPGSAGSSTKTVKPNSINGDLNDGQLDLIVTQESDGETDFDGNGQSISAYDQSTTLTVDGNTPNFGTPTPGDDATVTSKTSQITVPISDTTSSINTSTIEITISDGANNNKVVTSLVNIGQPNDGVSFTDGDLVVNPGTGDVPELPESSDIDVTVDAKDEAGNSNSLSFDFAVDVSGFNIALDNPSDEATINTKQPSIQPDFEGTVDDSTVAVSITGPDGNSIADLDSNSASYNSPNSRFDFTPANDLPEGQITVAASADDPNGNSVSQQFTFTTDFSGPAATNVQLSRTEVDAAGGTQDRSNTVTVTATFNETVQPGTVTANVDINNGGTTESISGFSDVNGDNSVVSDEIDFSDSKYNSLDNGSAVVEITAATDTPGNTIASGDSATFSIDTSAPTVSGPSPPLPRNSEVAGENGILSGYVDLTNHFSVTGEPSKSDLVYELDLGRTGGFDTAVNTPANVDTTTLPEGDHELRVSATDDAGNSDSQTVKFEVDNVDPSLTTTGPSEVTGVVDITEQFSVSNNGSYTVTYGFENADGKQSADAAISNPGKTVDTDSFNDGETIVFEAEVSDTTGSDVTVRKEATVTQGDLTEDSGLSLTQTNIENAQDEVQVKVEADENLTELNVTLSSDDQYFKQGSDKLTIGEFSETQANDGDVEYTYSEVPSRDGKYRASVTAATTESGNSIDGNFPADATVQYDVNAPSISEAELVGGDNSQTDIRVEFSEPLTDSVELSDFTWTGSANVVTLATDEPAEGYAVVHLDKGEAQTGTDETLNLTATDAVTERFGDGSDNGGTAGADAKFEFQVSQGVNVVSIPAETGEVDLTNVNLPSEIQKITTYDESSDAFQAYIPGQAADDITTMRGGIGYVVRADGSAEVDVEVENRPLGGSGVAPDTADVQPGYNLLGAFQEGQQPTDQAFATLNNQDYSVEKGYTGNTVSSVSPGQGYWVFANSDGFTKPVDYDGLTSDRPTVANIDTESVNDNGDTGFSQDDEIRFYADVSDDSLVNSVTLKGENMTGVSDVTLTDADNDGQFDTTIDGSVNSLGFTESVSAGVRNTLTVTAVDSEGNLARNTGQTDPVESVSPAPASPSLSASPVGDANTGDGNEVTLTQNFGEEMTQDATDVTVTPDVDGDLSSTSVQVENKRWTDATTFEADLQFSDADEEQSGVTVKVEGANDLAGNTMSPTTKDYAVDTAPVTLDSASRNSDTKIDVTLSDGQSGIDKASIGSGDFSLSAGSVSSIDKSGVTDGATGAQTVTITLSSAVDSDTVDVSLQSDGIDDKAGNNQQSGTKTASGMDGVDPTLKSATESGSGDGEITVTIGDGVDVDETTIDQADFTLDSGSITSVASGPSDSGSDATITLDVSSTGGTPTAVSLDTGGSISDAAGNTLADGEESAVSTSSP